MTKYFLNVTSPLEQLLCWSLFVSQMKWEVTHTTSILWSSLQPGKACFRGSTTRTPKKRSRADVGYVLYFEKVLAFRNQVNGIKFVFFPLYNFNFLPLESFKTYQENKVSEW